MKRARRIRSAWLWFLAPALGACGDSGSTTGPPPPVPPPPPESAIHFTAVEVGQFHTCALATTGEAYCWGINYSGELGIPPGPATCPGPILPDPVPCESRPRPVSGGLVFTSLALGGGATCGLTAAGAAYCWGDNDSGELGNGTTTDSSTPVPVAGGHVFESLSVSPGHACGVTRTGEAYCWGTNERGELGTTADLETCVRFVITGDEEYPCSSRPVPVAGGLSWVSLSTGGANCGVTTGGEGYCWGHDQYGQAGTGAASADPHPTPQPVVGGVRFETIATRSVTSCGIATGGAAYCWGRNRFGSLGIGASDSNAHPAPEPVSGGLTFTALSVGFEYACGVTPEDAAYCWGIGSSRGTLGTGTGDLDAPSPAPVSGPVRFRSVSAHLDHTCGIGTDDLAYCWGSNDVGQLGTGGLDDNPHPRPVPVFGQG